ncbi:hypothetical protein ILYODFUR_031867, partial [Ilyodon furcidens]
EKRPKVKKPKVEFPVYVPSENQSHQSHQSLDQTTSIEDIEDQMDDWLQDFKAAKKKVSEWTEDELSLLSRLMVKFPGGTPGRWEKIAQELGRSVSAVTTKVKQVKDNVNHTSDLKAPPLPARSVPVDDSVMTQRVGGPSEEEQQPEEEEVVPVVQRRNRKSSSADSGEGKVRGRRQKDFDPTAVGEEEEAELQENKEKVNPATWTQNQQKLLELALQQFPRGTTERWDRIAKVVPGKSKEDCMIRYKMLAELVKKRKQVRPNVFSRSDVYYAVLLLMGQSSGHICSTSSMTEKKLDEPDRHLQTTSQPTHQIHMEIRFFRTGTGLEPSNQLRSEPAGGSAELFWKPR